MPNSTRNTLKFTAIRPGGRDCYPAVWIQDFTLIAILKEDYPEQARAIWGRFIRHMRDQAFTKGSEFNAPWECFGWGGAACQNPVFGPSVTVPYSVLAHIERRMQCR